MNIREQGWTNREIRVREDRAAARHKQLEDDESMVEGVFKASE